MKSNIGFMQGRLSDQVNGEIQAFPWDTWQDEFKVANELGLTLMEWTIDHERLNENPLLTYKGRSTIKELSNKYNIKIPSLTGDCFMQAPFWKEKNINSQNILKENFLLVLNACAKLNIKYIVLPLVDNGKIVSESEYLILHNFLNKVTPVLKKSKIKIAFETNFNPLKNKQFIDKFNPNIFGINYDTGNSAALGFDPDDEFNCYSNNIMNVHIKDRLYSGTTVPLGTGNTDFVKVMRLLKEIQYHGNYILQTARAQDGNHVSTLIKYKNYIEKIWDGIIC